MNWFIFAIKNSFDYQGRAARPQYWFFALFWTLLFIPVEIARYTVPLFGTVIYALFMLALFSANVSVTMRRLHDTNRSAWWLGGLFLVLGLLVIEGLLVGDRVQKNPVLGLPCLVTFLAYMGLCITLLVFLCQKGTEGANRYGAPAPTSPN